MSFHANSDCDLVVFCSPHETPFEDGTFKLTMEFSEEYPNKPPVVRFVSKMFHPNGKCCNLFIDIYELNFFVYELHKPYMVYC